jgi:hypothetical protein
VIPVELFVFTQSPIQADEARLALWRKLLRQCSLRPMTKSKASQSRKYKRRGTIVRCVTHQFAHVETLERARRWMVQAGIDRSRIGARTQGILSLAVAVEAGESAEVQRIIDVAEFSDPDGDPGIWELASRRHVHSQVDTSTITVGTLTQLHSFVVGWHPPDADREVTQTNTGVELQKHYQEERD